MRAFGFQKHRSCVEEVFRQSLLAERQTEEGKAVGGFLFDLANFYEHLDRGALLRRGLESGFPGQVMAVALNQYEGSRCIVLEGVARAMGHPKRGIPAGCGFATYWVQIYG